MIDTSTRRVILRSIEVLEARQLFAVTYGANAVLNGGGETYTGTANGTTAITPANWTANASPTVDPWSTGDGVSPAIPQPANTGAVFFTGGADQSESDFFQTIDLSSIATDIDAGKASYVLSALLGGFSSQTDNATVFVNFQDGSHFFVDQAFVGPVTATDRNSNTGLLPRSKTATVPAGTRFAQVQIHFERNIGSYNDGYADNVSLVLNGPTPPTLASGAVLVDTHAVAFTFGQSINASSVAIGDLDVTPLGSSTTTHPATAASVSGDGKTVTFVLPTTFADGSYRFRIPTGAILGSNGVASTANADFNSFILAGDLNRDQHVNFTDLLTLAKNYSQTPRTFSQGDFNYDGKVDFNDLLILAKHYGQ